MGNCCEKPIEDGGCGDVGGESGHCAKNRALLVQEDDESRGNVSREVKIRITRKQLEELLRRAGSGVPVRQVISELLCMEGCSGDKFGGQRQWRPSLQSIPE